MITKLYGLTSRIDTDTLDSSVWRHVGRLFTFEKMCFRSVFGRQVNEQTHVYISTIKMIWQGALQVMYIMSTRIVFDL